MAAGVKLGGTDPLVTTDGAGGHRPEVVIYGVGSGISGALPVVSGGTPATPVSHRSGVTAADVMAAPGTVTCTKQAGGSATAGTYTVFVVAVNAYGRTTATQGNTTITTETTNLTVRAAFAAVSGATHYDIYCSTDGANAKWVGRITEAERGTGIKITAVGVTGAGGTAGAVDVEVPGTGLAAATTAAVNTAYVPPAGLDCTGYQFVDLDIDLSRTGDAVAPSLTLVVFFWNALVSVWYAGDTYIVDFGGTAGKYESRKQRLRVECRGNAALSVAVASIAGTGASLTIGATLS